MVSTRRKDKYGLNKKNTQEGDSWMKEAPQEGQIKTKKVNNRKFYLCHHHFLWTRYSSDECFKDKSDKAGSKAKENKQGGKAKMDKALTTVSYEASDEGAEWLAYSTEDNSVGPSSKEKL